MKLVTIYTETGEKVALILPDGFLLLEEANKTYGTSWGATLDILFASDQFYQLKQWYQDHHAELCRTPQEILIKVSTARYAPLYRAPGKIWGIGLNYRAHASDLSEHTAPDEFPGSFMKAATTIIGPGKPILLPHLATKTTGEGELGVIIGKKCRNIPKEDWLDAVAGFTAIIDMTAEDILRKNVRYLTLAKNFDTFFAFGPMLLTPEEVPDVMSLKVATVRNGEIYAENVVSNMTFPPDLLVAFHSQVMTLLPGDIISTGTPRAVPLRDGDTVECRISGFPNLVNPVVDLNLK